MKAADWQIERVWAHLTLRGWRPVVTPCGRGIYNGDERKGWLLFQQHEPAGSTFGFELGKVYEFDSKQRMVELTWSNLEVHTLKKIAEWCWRNEVQL